MKRLGSIAFGIMVLISVFAGFVNAQGLPSIFGCRSPPIMYSPPVQIGDLSTAFPNTYCRPDCQPGEQCVVNNMNPADPCSCQPVAQDSIYACSGQMMFPPPHQPGDLNTSFPNTYCRDNCQLGDQCVVNNLDPTNPCSCQPVVPPQIFTCSGQQMAQPPVQPTDLPTSFPNTYCRDNCQPGEQCVVNNMNPVNPCSCVPLVPPQIFTCSGQQMAAPPLQPTDLPTSFPNTYCRNNCPNGEQCLVTNLDPTNPCTCSGIQQTSIISCNQQTMSLGIPLPGDLPTSDPSVYCRNDCALGQDCVVDLSSPTPSCTCQRTAPTILSCKNPVGLNSPYNPATDIPTGDPNTFCRNDCDLGQNCIVDPMAVFPSCSCGPAVPPVVKSCSSNTQMIGEISQAGDMPTSDPNTFCRPDCPSGSICKIRINGNVSDECYCEAATTSPGSGSSGSGSLGTTGTGGGELPEKKNCTSWAQASVTEKKTVTESDAKLAKIRKCTYTTYVRYCMSGSQIDFSIKDEYVDVECSKWADNTGSNPDVGSDCQYIQAGSLTEKEQTGVNCRECIVSTSNYYCKDTQKTYPDKKKTDRKCSEWAACQESQNAAAGSEQAGGASGQNGILEQIGQNPLLVIIPLGVIIAAAALFVLGVFRGSNKSQ